MALEGFGWIGVVVFLSSWVIALAYAWMGRTRISMGFLFGQALGGAIVCVDALFAGSVEMALLWFLNFVLSGIALVVLPKKLEQANRESEPRGQQPEVHLPPV